MNFELSPEDHAAQARARSLAAERIAQAAASIDDTAVVPPDLVRDVREAVSGTPIAQVVSVEEVAVVSAAAAAAGALGQSGAADRAMSGLRGFSPPPDRAAAVDDRGRLALAAVALGIGRAALDVALGVLREATTPPGGGDQDKPHWAVADAATELEAARLLTLAAAQATERGEATGPIALAKLAAAAAAAKAVDAALRVTGPEGLTRGSLLERLARDVRAVAVLLGTEEELRATAAGVLFPR